MTPMLGIMASGATGSKQSSFESIATATGTGSSGTITFSSIPSTYSHLQVRILGRSDAAAVTQSAILTINNDTGANYAYHSLSGDGTSVSASGTASASNIPRIMTVANTATANVMSVGIVDIHDYASTTKNKTVRIWTGDDRNGSGRTFLSSGLWQSTTAVNRLDIITAAGNWTTATTFALYGIKG